MKKRFTAILAVGVALALGLVFLAGCSNGGSSDASDSDAAKYKIAETLSSEHYAVGFKKGEDAMAAAVTKTLLEMDADGTVKTLCEKYADQGISYDNWCLEDVDTSKAADVPADVKFIVGFDAEYPPYGYRADDGSFTGFDLDLAAEVASRNGWEFIAEPIDWDSKDALIDSGQITCIWNGFTYEGRESEYAFSGLYMLNAQVIVVKGDSDVATIDDLAGKNVMTQAGSAAFEMLSDGGDFAEQAGTFASFTAVPDYNTAFMNLDSGAADAIVCDLSVANFYLAK